MIKLTKPISMPEALEYIKEDKEKELKAFIKKFNKLDEKKAKELREKIVGLNILKLNEKNVSKIIDTLPKDKDELNKVLFDVNLDENETNGVLETVKQFG